MLRECPNGLFTLSGCIETLEDILPLILGIVLLEAFVADLPLRMHHVLPPDTLWDLKFCMSELVNQVCSQEGFVYVPVIKPFDRTAAMFVPEPCNSIFGKTGSFCNLRTDLINGNETSLQDVVSHFQNMATFLSW